MTASRPHDTDAMTRNPDNPAAPTPRPMDRADVDTRWEGLADVLPRLQTSPLVPYNPDALTHSMSWSEDLGAVVVAQYSLVSEILTTPHIFRTIDTPHGVSKTLLAAPHGADPEPRSWVADILSRHRVEARIEEMTRLSARLANDLRDAGPAGDLRSQYAQPYVDAVIDDLIDWPPISETKRQDTSAVDLFEDLTKPGVGDHPLTDLTAEDILWAADNAKKSSIRLLLATIHLMLRDEYWATAYHAGAGPERRTIISRCIEETLRVRYPHRGLLRATTRPTRLGGRPLPSQTVLLLMHGTANLDPTVFPTPETVDPDRRNTHPHLGFGRGPHACPGAGLARTLVRTAITALLDHLPTMRLDHPDTGLDPTSHRIHGSRPFDVTWIHPAPHPIGKAPSHAKGR